MSQPNNDTRPQDEERRRVSREIAGRLWSLGLWLSGRESPDDLVQIEEAVERFEDAVQAQGGDLMVDESPRGATSQPDDPDFALPRRTEQESVRDYLEQLARATYAVRRHPTRASSD